MSKEYYEWLKRNKPIVDPYRLGRAFEYRVMKRLRTLGYYCVRKFGSKGEEDIVAWKHLNFLFIQCKWSRERDTKPENYDLRGLIALVDTYGGYAVFAGVKKHRMYFAFWLDEKWVEAEPK